MKVVVPHEGRGSSRPWHRGVSPAGWTWDVYRVGAYLGNEPSDGGYLYSGVEGCGYSTGQWLLSPHELSEVEPVLVTLVKNGEPLPEEDNKRLSGDQYGMFVLSPDLMQIGFVVANGPRRCFVALIPSLDAYFTKFGMAEEYDEPDFDMAEEYDEPDLKGAGEYGLRVPSDAQMTWTPEEIATEFGRDPKTVRQWLRDTYKRPEWEKNSLWVVTAEMREAAHKRWGGVS
jgi:hypothetical protein